MAKKKKKLPKIIRPIGKPRIFDSPDQLWNYFLSYVQHEADKPWLKIDYVGQLAHKVLIPLATPITFEGFECYLFDQGVTSDIGQYACNRNGVYGDYVTIIQKIRQNCFVQNFRGAAVGAFNANLIARKLGIKDQTATEVTVKDISEINFSMKRRE